MAERVGHLAGGCNPRLHVDAPGISHAAGQLEAALRESLVGHDRLELSANGLREGQGATQSESLREVAAAQGEKCAEYTTACSMVLRDDSSSIVTEKRDERGIVSPHDTVAAARPSLTVDDAFRIAIKLAVEAGEYDCAEVLLGFAKQATSPQRPVLLARYGDRERR